MTVQPTYLEPTTRQQLISSAARLDFPRIRVVLPGRPDIELGPGRHRWHAMPGYLASERRAIAAALDTHLTEPAHSAPAPTTTEKLT